MELYHKDLNAAKTLYYKALSYSEHHSLALLALTQLAVQQGDLQTAEKTLRSLISNDSSLLMC